MKFALFNHHSRGVYEGREKASPFEHTYGGTVDSHGIRIKNTRAPLHLLFELDLSDPAIDVRIPGVTRLPLLYGLHFTGEITDQRYIVHPDRSVEFFKLEGYSPDFGLEFPDAFPESPVSLERASFNPHKAEDALSCLQVFGLKHLSESELERAITIAYDNWPGLDVIEDWIVYKDLTKQEYLEFWGSPPFRQPGGISRSCDNPKCSSITHVSQQDSVRVIAMCKIRGILVIFSQCHLCQNIHVTNQTS